MTRRQQEDDKKTIRRQQEDNEKTLVKSDHQISKMKSHYNTQCNGFDSGATINNPQDNQYNIQQQTDNRQTNNSNKKRTRRQREDNKKMTGRQ